MILLFLLQMITLLRSLSLRVITIKTENILVKINRIQDVY